MRRFTLAVSLLIFTAAAAHGQTEANMLDQLAGLLNRGILNVEVDLKPGVAAITPEWRLQTIGSPKAKLTIEADQGQVQCAIADISGGELLISGSGFRPSLSVERIQFVDGGGIVEAKFRGRGVWRPIIAVFRTVARPALRRLQVPTDIRSILMGEVVTSKKSSDPSTPPEFLGLVRDVHIERTEFEAFRGYPMAIGEMVNFSTSSLRASIDRATFTPPAHFDVDGRIDGAIDDGAASFIGNHCRFAHGKLGNGAFHVSDGKVSFSAGVLDVDLTSGVFTLPGGPKVGVEAPSHFVVRDLRLAGDGSYSGIVDAIVSGKVGTIDRGGVSIAANNVRLQTRGARVANGQATGDVALQFDYRLKHTLTIHYPVEELRDRRVPLTFDGSFAAMLHFQNAGGGDAGSVAGTYQFTVPWAPVERAAFEVLRARWRQDIAPAIHRVDFAIEPRRFGPCGRDCFLLDLQVTAQKPKARGYWFQQICDTEGKADVVVDAPARTLLLRNVRVDPRCQGVLGAIANFIAPFLSRSYGDVALLQMPPELPFTVDTVASSRDSIVIAGNVKWGK